MNSYYRLINIDNHANNSAFELIGFRQMSFKQMQLFGQKHYGTQISLETLHQRFKELENKGVVDLYELTKPNTIRTFNSTNKHKFLKRGFFIKNKGSEGYHPILYFYYICVLLIAVSLVPISFFELIWQLMLDMFVFIINLIKERI